MVLNVHRNHKVYWGREEGGGEGVWRGGKRKIIYLSLHCQHQNDFYIKVGSDESHFTKSQDSVHRSQLVTRKESQSRFEPRSL